VSNPRPGHQHHQEKDMKRGDYNKGGDTRSPRDTPISHRSITATLVLLPGRVTMDQRQIRLFKPGIEEYCNAACSH
jgi:hypothetical protein